MGFSILPRALRERLHPPVAWLVAIVAWFTFAFLVHLAAFAFLEGLNWWEALWATWQTFSTVGYEDRPVPGAATRVIVMVVSTLGVLAVGAILTGFIEVRQFLRDRRRFGLMESDEQHGYVVINFPGEYAFLMFLSELREVEKDVPVCVVDSRLEELPAKLQADSRVHFVRGPILERRTYEQAGVREAKSVIVFPLEPYDPSSDGTTRTIVDLVSRFVRPEARIIHVLVSPENHWIFEDTRSTSVLGSFEYLAVVQEAQDPHSAPIAEALFRNSVGPRPITVKPSACVGMTWGDFLQSCARTTVAMRAHLMPWALVRDGKPDLTPAPETVIAAEDLLSLITDDRATWDAFEKALVANQSRQA